MLEMGVQLFASLILTGVVVVCSYYSQTSDYTTINGQVTEKVRDNDSHEESYDCRCRTVSSGGKNPTTSTKCDTCWRTVYTVDWYLKSTIGSIDIDHDRSYSPTIWLTSDPDQYTRAYVGEPCSKKDFFVNYIKSAEKSLFNTSNYEVKSTLPVPTYPELYGIYQIDNVLNVGTTVSIREWNDYLRDRLKTLSPEKQVNIILIFANTNDKMYRYKVEKEWTGGKKNDYVVIIGTTDSKTASWVDGFTFGLSHGNHLMLSEVQSELTGKELKKELIVGAITDKVAEKFVRKSMKDFKYLAKDIQPSDTATFILIALQLLLNISLTFFNIKYDLDSKLN